MAKSVNHTKRILALDLIRGLFLVVIMINHLELYPSGWDFLTGKGRLWVSAAEGFFFLSGLLVGMVYKNRLSLGIKFIFKKMWRRAAQLYVAGTSLTFIFLAWVEFTHHLPIKSFLPSPLPWTHYAFETLITHFTYGWGDFLVRFVPLMLIAPFVFYLIARRKWWLALAGMVSIWVFRGQSFTLAWQLIFNLGILIGFYWSEISNYFKELGASRQKIIKRAFAWVAGVSFSLSYAAVYILAPLKHHYDSLTPWLRHLIYTWDRYNEHLWLYAPKWTLGPARVILFLVWFPVIYWLFRKYENRINHFSRGILELLGRNSLFVYGAHAFIVFGLKMYFIPAKTNFWQNFLITTIGLTLLIAITKGYRNLVTWSKSNDLPNSKLAIANTLVVLGTRFLTQRSK